MGHVSLQEVAKFYRQYPGKWHRIAEWLTGRSFHEKRWVLKDISLEVPAGQALGLVGVNGAGKSTLLKLITGTAQPSNGAISVAGRVAALLELGMGFHPDFTGRQNVYMAGQLLGMKPSEITTNMQAIEDFAEIGDYIDRPTRVYSSGMQMRLAFSLATAIRPDVLVVDEALSVGDSYFQHKCFDRIRSFKQAGTTILFVSHDRGAIQALCDRAVFLENGFVIHDGPPAEVMDYYNATIAEREQQVIDVERTDDGRAKTRSGSGGAATSSIRLLDDRERPIEVASVGQSVTLEIVIGVTSQIPRLILGIGIKDRLGQTIYGTNTHYSDQALHDLQPGEEVTFRVHFPITLGPGSYSISTALTDRETHLVNNYEWQDIALVFNVLNTSEQTFAGCNWMQTNIEISVH